MASESRPRRKRHSAELKAQILAECAVPGASVARVAMSHGINANVVHRWRQLVREGGSTLVKVPMATALSTAADGFVPVAVVDPPTAAAKTGDIRIELRRGPTALTIRWPVSAATDCAAWLRELLR
jgi:transposase